MVEKEIGRLYPPFYVLKIKLLEINNRKNKILRWELCLLREKYF